MSLPWGEVAELVHRPQSPYHDSVLRVRNAAAAGVRPLSSLRLLPEVVDPFITGLRCGLVHGSCSLGQVALRTVWPG